MDLKSKIAHFFAGIVTPISVIVHPIMPIISFAAFLSYELVEYSINGDKAWIDILEYVVGLYLSITGLVIYTVWNKIIW